MNYYLTFPTRIGDLPVGAKFLTSRHQTPLMVKKQGTTVITALHLRTGGKHTFAPSAKVFRIITPIPAIKR